MGVTSVLPASLGEALAAALGSPVMAARSLAGGDINQAFAVTLADEREVFVKTNANAPSGMFAAEARGLAWLAEARALAVPQVLAASPAGGGGPEFLVLELLRQAKGRPVVDFDDQLGRGLAALHRSGAPSFGLDHDNFIGRLPQANGPVATSTWAEFYRTRRLEPQLRQAVNRGLASAGMRRGFEKLFARLPALVGPEEAPSRLHGDLWGGNLMRDERGLPCLIDPAVYGGHREVDLAMMHLFGGFAGRVFAAYEETWPLGDGARERVALYQLYPLMVHVNLFGGGYGGQVEAALKSLV
ncbi:MAG TPA: fructosamine kinase family protein [Polyangia bacterium]|jgi:fructosamine-3-kinase|nr:fructosamine kinase family protein [Polyangia bacterium]